jgi:Fe2+ or Zn2+ uptake regulation protein
MCGAVDHHEGELVDQIRSHLGEQHEFVSENIDLVVTGICSDCRDSAGLSSHRAVPAPG